METDNPYEKVLDRLREKGWTKFSLEAIDGSHCVRGAAWKALGEWDTLCEFLAPIVIEQYPFVDPWQTPNCIVLEFNDDRRTTFSDVERVLEKAAIKWEEDQINATS